MDDWGGIPVSGTPVPSPSAAQPDDWGGVPVAPTAPPKLPDTQPVVDMVQKNLTAQPVQPDNAQPQTDAQKIDAGLGFPATAALKGGDGTLPPDHRAGLVQAYQDGTATSAGDYMQSVLPTAAGAATSPFSHYAQEAGRDALGLATWANPYTIAAHLFDIPLQAGALATQFALEHTPADSIFHMQPGSAYNAPPTFGALFDKIGETLFPGGAPQSKTAEMVDAATQFAGAGGILGGPTKALKAWDAFTGAALGVGGQFSQEKAQQWAQTNFPDSPVIQNAIGQAAGLLSMVGAGTAMHAAGHAALAPTVAEAIGKPADAVTPQDTNQVISKAFDAANPKAQDFHDVATVMDANGSLPIPPGKSGLKWDAAGVPYRDDIEPPPPPAGVGALKQPLYDFPKKPQTLTDFLANNGGLKDDTGDLAAMDADKAHRNLLTGKATPFARKLIRDDGANLDDAGLRAQQAGYFPELQGERPTTDQLLSKISDDLSGNPQYSEHDTDAAQAYHDALNRNAEVDRMSNETGIDTAGKTHQQFWDAVNEHLSYEDAGAKIDDLTQRAENSSQSWRTEALEPEEKEAKELENARQQKQATEAQSVIPTGGGESRSVSGTEKSGEANAGRIGSGSEPPRGANEGRSTADTLRLIYKETGVRPDQVFEDAKNNPEIAKDVAAGKVPDAYRQATGGGGQGGEPPFELQSQEPSEPKRNKQPRSGEGASSQATKTNFPRAIFDPANISESSKDMATAIRQAIGPKSQFTAQVGSRLEADMKAVNALSRDEQLNFIHYMENESKGQTAPTDIPDHLKPLAEELRSVYDEMHKQANAAGIDLGYIEGYHPHEFEDEKAYENFYSDWVAKQGGTRNLKERTFPTLQEAMEAGLKPKTTNPIEAAMRYVENMGNLIAAHKIVRAATEGGIADFFVKGNQPEGWVPLNGNLAEKSFVPEGSNSGEKITKILYAPEDAARVYNNDISQQATSPFDTVANAVQRASNFATKLTLGLSGYHGFVTAMSSVASDLGRALTGGTIGERLSDVASAITPGMNIYKGGKLLDAYLGREQLPEGLQKALDLAVKNNTINPKQQDYWKATAAGDFWDTFRKGGVAGLAEEARQAGEAIKKAPISGAVKTIANGFGRTLDTLTHPIFDFQIPRLKIAANIAEVHDWLQQNPDATPQEQDRAAQAIGDSIDNRFGEMMRDNLFWHKWTKDAMQLTFLSYSWVAGALRMVKGVPDTGAWLLSGGKEGLSSSAKYLFGVSAAYALANSAMTYWKTGQGPDDWRDLLSYRTGGTTEQGTPERALLPSHTGQFMHYIHDGLTGEMANELSPLLKLVIALHSNRDYRDLPITNENNSWFTAKPWGDYLKYIGQENAEPIGVKNVLQGEKKGSKITKLEQFMGDRPAPEFFASPDAYDKMMKNVNDRAWNRKVKSDKHLQEQYGQEDND